MKCIYSKYCKDFLSKPAPSKLTLKGQAFLFSIYGIRWPLHKVTRNRFILSPSLLFGQKIREISINFQLPKSQLAGVLQAPDGLGNWYAIILNPDMNMRRLSGAGNGEKCEITGQYNKKEKARPL